LGVADSRETIRITIAQLDVASRDVDKNSARISACSKSTPTPICWWSPSSP
jgi:hypothetical protein